MKRTVITVTQRKGGVGKSTSTLNLAHVFAEKGYKVLIIDLDDQRNTSRSISKIVDSDKTIEDLILNENITLDDVCVKTTWGEVYILPASPNLSGIVKHLNDEVGGHLVLKEKIQDNDFFDIILLDTSPSLNILVMNAYCASDYLFTPVESEYFALMGLTQTMESFNKTKSRLNPDLGLLGIGIVCHDKRNTLANEIKDNIFKKYADCVFTTIIGTNIKIQEAQTFKKSILAYASGDRGADQYRQLGNEILDRIINRDS